MVQHRTEETQNLNLLIWRRILKFMKAPPSLLMLGLGPGKPFSSGLGPRNLAQILVILQNT